jgi:hypothetical protein
MADLTLAKLGHYHYQVLVRGLPLQRPTCSAFAVVLPLPQNL